MTLSVTIFKQFITWPIELPISECDRELLFVSPGAEGKEAPCKGCFSTDDAVLSSSSSSSDADPSNKSVEKQTASR